MRKIFRRWLPFLLFTYLLTYVGRINVGFASLTVHGGQHMSAHRGRLCLRRVLPGHHDGARFLPGLAALSVVSGLVCAMFLKVPTNALPVTAAARDNATQQQYITCL